MPKIFGYTFGEKETNDVMLPSFDIVQDGSAELVESSSVSGGVIGHNLNEAGIHSEQELIKTYREISKSAEVGLVINEVKNETFIFEGLNSRAIDIRFYDDSDLSDQIKTKISEEFVNIYNLLDFKNKGNELFMDWYIDSKLFLHKIVDIKNLRAGIQKIVQVDPLKIRKFVEYDKADKNGLYNLAAVKDYYVFSHKFDEVGSKKKNWEAQQTTIDGIKIGPEYITYCDSGLYDKNNNIVLGHLYKAITPYNNLKLMEESLLIYRVARSPERRVFYVDVGNLPNNKAEQYLKSMMNRFRTRFSYDSKTGTLMDRTNVLSMVEDYWLPRKNGSTGTEIQTLPSGDNTGVTADVQYFKEKFLKSLNVPLSRFQDENPTINYGATTSEIARDEYRFKKFIDSLRARFSFVFLDLLHTQLVLKNIITESEWDDIKSDIIFVYEEDNNFVESKELEIVTKRMTALDAISEYEGKYYSKEWIQRNILKMSDEQIEQMDLEINGEANPESEVDSSEPESNSKQISSLETSEPTQNETESESSSEEPTNSKQIDNL